MNDNTLTPDRYAGDEAWQDWFDICSVGGCPAEHSAALRRQVESAMYSTLSKRGISREDEANFIAFLVCEASEDPYVRYAGYMNLLQYVMNALYKTDPALYKTAYMT